MPVRKDFSTYVGRPCTVCGGTKRFVAGRHCVSYGRHHVAPRHRSEREIRKDLRDQLEDLFSRWDGILKS
jgi:hypothetical protein